MNASGNAPRVCSPRPDRACKRNPFALCCGLEAAATMGLLQIRLHFSLRGDAKCVRGPSESSASRLARADALDRTSSTASKRKEVMAVLFRASAAGQ